VNHLVYIYMVRSGNLVNEVLIFSRPVWEHKAERTGLAQSQRSSGKVCSIACIYIYITSASVLRTSCLGLRVRRPEVQELLVYDVKHVEDTKFKRPEYKHKQRRFTDTLTFKLTAQEVTD
jgi:hypothetical protein